ncbi:MAG: sigma-70 family RNA polymerase sigma factor [Deltaproteobacteria bacterium]|nr:sigma-70 family RNA polymerase sigma factor [Deltaproteobacteria bacterium]
MEDWELLEAWRDGHVPSGQILLKRYLGLLTRFFQNRVSNPDDVAELVSETMLACTRARERMRDSGAFRSFLISCAMNTLRLYFRTKAKRSREVDDFANTCVGEQVDHPRSVTSMIAIQQEGRLLVRALRQLPLDQQIVLELHYFENLNGTEIAQLLGTPKQTAYTRLKRGTDKLRALVTAQAESPELAASTMMGLRTWAAQVRDELPD